MAFKAVEVNEFFLRKCVKENKREKPSMDHRCSEESDADKKSI